MKNEDEMLVVRIDPRVWYRGNGPSGSRLLRYDGRRCCIGILCGQLGIPDEEIREIGSVTSRHYAMDARLEWLANHAVVSDINIYVINDNKTFATDEERLMRINDISREYGIQFVLE